LCIKTVAYATVFFKDNIINKTAHNRKQKNKRSILIIRLIFIALIGVLSVIYYRYIQAHTEKLEHFCNNIIFGESYNKIYSLAKAQDLSIPFFAKSTNKLIIYNHLGPLFKVSCDIKFSDDKVYAAKISLDN